MGTEITLDVGGMCLDYSKNSRGFDHGALFQKADRKRLHSEQINYDYFDNPEDPELREMEMSFSKSLANVLPRLELLGHGLGRIEDEYNRTADLCRDERRSLDDNTLDSLPEIMSFAEFSEYIVASPISALDDTVISSVNDESDHLVMGRFSDEKVKRRIPRYSRGNFFSSYSERSYFGDLIGILHPYSLLRLLAENQENQHAQVVWQYGPLVSAGWASNAEFEPNVRRKQTFLIATEGSSDAHILKHAFSLLRPEIADFFRFIDMSDGYPFTGAGNLVRFASGLAKIDVHNKIVFLLDNDSEGLVAYRRINELSLPPNMQASLLPDLEKLSSIPARGPDGVKTTDINGRAAAIECYLDLEAPGLPSPEIIWTTYKKQLEEYHGALQKKETYMKNFLEQTSTSVSAGKYDVSKLMAVTDKIYSTCCSIASDLSVSTATGSMMGQHYGSLDFLSGMQR